MHYKRNARNHWGDGNVLYLDCGESHNSICQNSQGCTHKQKGEFQCRLSYTLIFKNDFIYLFDRGRKNTSTEVVEGEEKAGSP